MSTQTPNYRLEKPAQTDYYDVDVFNGNMDVVDAELSERLPVVLLPEVGANLDGCTNGVYLHNGASVAGSMSEVDNAPKETDQPFVLKSYIWARGVHTGGQYPQAFTNGKQTIEYADGDVYERYKAGIFSGMWFPWRLISQDGAPVDVMRIKPLTQSVDYCKDTGVYVYDRSTPYSYRQSPNESTPETDREIPRDDPFILEVYTLAVRVGAGGQGGGSGYVVHQTVQILTYVTTVDASMRAVYIRRQTRLASENPTLPTGGWRSMDGENPNGHSHTVSEAVEKFIVYKVAGDESAYITLPEKYNWDNFVLLPAQVVYLSTSTRSAEAMGIEVRVSFSPTGDNRLTVIAPSNLKNSRLEVLAYLMRLPT